MSQRAAARRSRPRRSRLGPACRSSAGFTLIELAIVVALIGLLATLGSLVAVQITQRAKVTAAAAQLVYLRQVLLTYAANCDGLPVYTGASDPGVTTKPSGVGACWTGPYLSRWPTATSFGQGRYEYQGQRGQTAVVRVTGLPQNAASWVNGHLATIVGNGNTTLATGSGGWTVSLSVGNQYPPLAPAKSK